jgi:hypothetical protein
MTRRTTLTLLVLSILFSLLVAPVAAQEEASPEPSAEPTPIPAADGPLVQAVLYFSPTCGHCHKVISEDLPPLFAEHGGMPVTSYDQSIPPEEVAFYLMSNGRLQILFVDTTIADGQAMFMADSVRLDIDQAGVPRLDIEETYLVGSADIPDRFPGIVADGLAGEGVSWPPVPGIDRALAPFIEMGVVPALETLAAADSGDATAEASDVAAD